MLATLTSKGQVTVPKEIREALKLDAGAKLDFVLQPDGTIVARPMKNSFRDIIGLLKKPGRPALSLEDIDEAIAAQIGADEDRVRRQASSLPAKRRSRTPATAK